MDISLTVSRQKLRIFTSAWRPPPFFRCFGGGVLTQNLEDIETNHLIQASNTIFRREKIISWGPMALTEISIAIPKISQSPLLSKIPQMNFLTHRLHQNPYQ